MNPIQSDISALSAFRHDDSKPRILCVDDEAHVLKGLSRQFHSCGYPILTAGSAADGLQILDREPDIAVVIADMRMPMADGATFLRLARKVAPDAVRIVLSGQADVASAAAAVNQGQIFAYLEKPATLGTLMGTVEAALGRYRLNLAQALLLEQLGPVHPVQDPAAAVEALFGRICRIFACDYAAMGFDRSVPALAERVLVHGLDPALFDAGADSMPAALAPLREQAQALQLRRTPERPVDGLPEAHPLVSRLLALPLARAGQSYGWLYFADARRTGAFGVEDEQAAAMLATACASLCETLRPV